METNSAGTRTPEGKPSLNTGECHPQKDGCVKPAHAQRYEYVLQLAADLNHLSQEDTEGYGELWQNYGKPGLHGCQPRRPMPPRDDAPAALTTGRTADRTGRGTAPPPAGRETGTGQRPGPAGRRTGVQARGPAAGQATPGGPHSPPPAGPAGEPPAGR